MLQMGASAHCARGRESGEAGGGQGARAGPGLGLRHRLGKPSRGQERVRCHRAVTRQLHSGTPRTRKPQARQGSPQLLCRKRLRELENIIRARYGAILPYDDNGIDDLEIAAHHIAHIGGDAVEHIEHILAWARKWLPQMPLHQVRHMAERVVTAPRKFKAATLGWRLRLTEAKRIALNITTIQAAGTSDADMKEGRKRKKRERMAQRRAREHKPKKVPLRESRPWEALGMSRASWCKGKPSLETSPPERETKCVRSRKKAPPCCAPILSHHAQLAVREKAIREGKDTTKPSCSLDTVSLGGFRVMPCYPEQIKAQAKWGWWGRSGRSTDLGPWQVTHGRGSRPRRTTSSSNVIRPLAHRASGAMTTSTCLRRAKSSAVSSRQTPRRSGQS
jgi:hypothetical protein